jgi:simple sugar transport system substrate-binding protein
MAAAAIVLTGCSASGGKETDEDSGGGTGAGTADTDRVKVAMITHEAPGDAFWDRIRKGAEAAAAKDNVDLVYSNDPQAPKQAALVQNAIDQKVDAIAVTLSNPDALGPVVKKASDAGIPVVLFNAGLSDTVLEDTGAIMYFGQDETIAGEAVGARLSEDGAQHAICVVQEQGQVQLEARCDGVEQGFSGGRTQKLYVNGRNMPSVLSDIQAKLAEDQSIDRVVTLGADFALTAIKAVGTNAADRFNQILEYRPDRFPEQPQAGPFFANMAGFLCGLIYGFTGVQPTREAPPARESQIGGRAPGSRLEEAPGGTLDIRNPARLDETVAEARLGDATTFVEACAAARDTQASGSRVPASTTIRRAHCWSTSSPQRSASSTRGSSGAGRGGGRPPGGGGGGRRAPAPPRGGGVWGAPGGALGARWGTNPPAPRAGKAHDH